jgi:ATP-binding cassette, subfamily B, beta-glucan exporter
MKSYINLGCAGRALQWSLAGPIAETTAVMKNCTTFVIAHRLSTVRNATRILVFENGRIIETGTFDELVRIGGRFAALAKAQFMTAETKTETMPEALPVET